MRTAKSSLSGIAGVLPASVVSSWAIPSSLDMHFRSTAWAPTNGNLTYSVGGTTATGYQDVLVGTPNATLAQSSTYGLGVDSRIQLQDTGEVVPREMLDITFSSAQWLRGAWGTKLFRELATDSGSVTLSLAGLGIIRR
jgi:hypothetical protein